MPESLLLYFGQKLEKTDFLSVYLQPTPSQMVDEFQDVIQKMVEDTFPLKSIIVSSEDQPFLMNT